MKLPVSVPKRIVFPLSWAAVGENAPTVSTNSISTRTIFRVNIDYFLLKSKQVVILEVFRRLRTSHTSLNSGYLVLGCRIISGFLRKRGQRSLRQRLQLTAARGVVGSSFLEDNKDR